MNKSRPINLDLTKFRFPPMAIVSILHRISGVVLFLVLPVLLYFFHQSLLSEASFNNLQFLLLHNVFKLLLWVILAATAFHFVAGIRHLLMDLGYGESLVAGRRSAILVFWIVGILVLFFGVWLWV